MLRITRAFFVGLVFLATTSIRAQIPTSETMVAKQSRIIADQIALTNRAIDEETWAGAALDYTKQWLPLYTEVKLRGLVRGVPVYSGLLEDNLREQTQRLFGLPLNNFENQYSAIIGGLLADNPHLANRFNSSMDGLTDSERFLSNALSVAQLIALPLLIVLYWRSRARLSFGLKWPVPSPSTATLRKAALVSGFAWILGAAFAKAIESQNIIFALNLHDIAINVFGTLTLILVVVLFIRATLNRKRR